MAHKKNEYVSPLPTANGKTAPYFTSKYISVLGKENPHLKNWTFPNGQPPNINEAWFSGRDAGAAWAACDAKPAELEAFLCLYKAGKVRADDFNSIYEGPAHNYLEIEVTYGRKAWICSDLAFARAFTGAFIETVLRIDRLLPSNARDRHADSLPGPNVILN